MNDRGEIKVSAVIPAYNEAAYIADTLRGLQQCPGIDEILVVDDGSTDRTAEIAAIEGARVLSLARNGGKGRAMQFGWRQAKGEIIVFLDADLGETACEAFKLIQPLVEGRADMSVAIFPKTRWKGGLGFVVRLARWGIRTATNRSVSEPLSGQRAVRRALMARLEPLSKGFGVEVGMTIDALRAGGVLIEVPTSMTHRLTGRDARSIRHRFRQLIDVAGTLLAKSISRKGCIPNEP